MAWKRKNVVVPVDFSENSAPAVRTAFEFVDDRANVTLVHVLMPLDYVSPGVAWGNVDNESREKALEHHMAEFISENELDGVQSAIRFGNPGLEISEFASKSEADLVLIPSHGYHGFKRMLLGSVAESVVRHVECPVLVLRREDAD